MCRFFNEEHPKGFQVTIKKGFAELEKAADRRRLAKTIIEDEMNALYDGYNPTNGAFENIEHEISHHSPVIPSLWFAHKRLDVSDGVKKNIEFFIKRFEKAFNKGYLAIGDLRKRDIKEIFENIQRTNTSKARSLDFIFH